MIQKEKFDVEYLEYEFETTADLTQSWTEFRAVTTDGQTYNLQLSHEV